MLGGCIKNTMDGSGFKHRCFRKNRKTNADVEINGRGETQMGRSHKQVTSVNDKCDRRETTWVMGCKRLPLENINQIITYTEANNYSEFKVMGSDENWWRAANQSTEWTEDW